MTSTNPPAPRTPDPNNPDQHDQPSQPEGKSGKLDLSLTQVLGGALAAMTAAALGSRLGVAGTISGAAVASVVAGVASSLYTASLRHTREKVKTVWTGRIAGTETPAAIDVRPEEPHWELPQAPVTSTATTRSGVSWKGVLVGAAATFAVAAVALTGFELLAGQALSGGNGTTIAQVGTPQKAAPTKSTPKPSKSATPSTSETPSETPSSSPSATPSATETPSASATPSAPTSSTPSTQAETPAPSATPTATQSPSAEETPVN